MPLISGQIPNLINGVSQQPATLRMPTQGEDQENGLSHIARGLEKRPCTEHVAELSGITSADSNDVFIHTIRRTEDEAYALAIKGGTSSVDPEIKLIDLTGYATGTAGNEVYIQPDSTIGDAGPVTSNGTLDATVVSYLSNFTASGGTNDFSPNKLGSTTIADFTFILNKTQKVKKNSSSRHETRPYETLIYVKVGDYDSHYKVLITEYKVDSDGVINRDLPDFQWEVEYITPHNETESLTKYSATKSINNQAAVVVSTIAETLYEGAFITQLVDLKEDTVNSTVKIVEAGTNTEYTGSDGVITQGTVTTRKRTWNTGTSEWNNWVTQTTNKGIKGIFADDPTHFAGSFGTGVTGDPIRGFTHGESLIAFEDKVYPFTVEVTDGKGDTYIEAINGHDETSSFGKLPASKVPLGFTAKVSGDRNTGQDDYYVSWNESVWKETFKPLYPGGTADYSNASLLEEALDSLDNSTMPVQLYKAFDTNDNIYFILKPVTWDKRTVGSDEINPFPSFSNYNTTDFPDGLYTINDIFFHRNRLGFISDENVILSEAAEYFNFFAKTVLSILDTGMIDVAVSNNQVAILKSAIPFQQSLVLFSDLQQFKLTSDQFLTPTSVTVDVATNFETSTDTNPVAAGKTIFFPFKRGAYSGIREYFIDRATEINDANEITAHVPDYIEGTVRKMAVSSNEETLLILSDTDRRDVFVYKYFYSEQEKLQSSWSKWKFDAEVIDMSFIGSIAFILFRRGTSVYLEKINLSVDNATDIMNDKIGVKLDRRFRLKQGEVTTVPYSDVNHDAVTSTTVRTNGEGKGIKIQIDGVDNKPRIGQTFKSAHDATTTFTILDASDVVSNECEITITPSIDANKPIPDNTVLTFNERELVYIMETGRMITASQLSGILQNGDEFSRQKGITNPSVFVGIPYRFKYEFSEQFVKSGDNSINSGRLQMRNFEISYDKTGFFEVEIAPKPYDDRLRKINKRTFTGQLVGSSFLGIRRLETGVYRVPVYSNSKNVRIIARSDEWYPVALQSVDWEAMQVLRNQRI